MMKSQIVKKTHLFVIPKKLVLGLIEERESIFAVTYKFLDSRFCGNDKLESAITPHWVTTLMSSLFPPTDPVVFP